MMRRGLGLLLLLAMLGALLPLTAVGDHGEPAPNGNCPEPKVEDNAVDQDWVPTSGTHLCLKGSTKIVFVTADGTSTIKELLDARNPKDKLKDVSHYSVIPPSTTSTTEPEDTTTTEPGNTTTTTQDTTTTTVQETTTTTDPENTTTTIVEAFCVDLNTASVDLLSEVKHIDQVRAQRIIDARPFEASTQAELRTELIAINEIGEVRVEDLLVPDLPNHPGYFSVECLLLRPQPPTTEETTTTIDPTTTTTDPETTTTDDPESTEETLPFTGSSSASTAAVALVALLAGGGLLLLTPRTDE